MKTFRTLCSGGELFGVGARAAGWTHVDGYEIDPAIAAVARLNGFDVRAADVTRIDYASLPPADHLHASPSCKTASQANTAGGETADDRAVAAAICRAIRAHQGRTFSLENVWAYRNYEAFAHILATLHDCGFGVHFAHVNSADFGVPQTRKRLILRAVRGVDRVPGLRPTHGKRGGILLARWNGWYAAIADILHTLPPTEPAPWQLARLPTELRETMWKAYIVGGGNTQLGQIDSVARPDSAPMFTVSASDGARKVAAAYLLSGENAGQEWGKGYRTGSAAKGTSRAVITGRWVRMTVQALGRFQAVPDSYVGLTPEINGNGVPCDLARAIMESL